MRSPKVHQLRYCAAQWGLQAFFEICEGKKAAACKGITKRGCECAVLPCMLLAI